MKALNNKKKGLIISIIIVLIIIVGIVVYNFFKVDINFNNENTLFQYGEEFNYEDIIQSTNPSDVEIEYSDIEIGEVGVYDLSFTANAYGQTVTKKFKFQIVDTIVPDVTVKYKDEIIEVNQGRIYDPSSNISEIEGLSEEGSKNFEALDNEQFDARVNEVENAYISINERVIGDDGKIESIEAKKDYIFYTTNFDPNIIGEYEINYVFVDSNYNYLEYTQKINTVSPNEVVNTGGHVVCNYPIMTEDRGAVSNILVESYTYNEDELIIGANAINTTSLSSDFQTADNLRILQEQLNTTFAIYQNVEGVSISFSTSGYTITTNIVIDYIAYDKVTDPLELLEYENGTLAGVESLFERTDGGSCVAQ